MPDTETSMAFKPHWAKNRESELVGPRFQVIFQGNVERGFRNAEDQTRAA
jgi:hypothetical protein